MSKFWKKKKEEEECILEIVNSKCICMFLCMFCDINGYFEHLHEIQCTSVYMNMFKLVVIFCLEKSVNNWKHLVLFVPHVWKSKGYLMHDSAAM